MGASASVPNKSLNYPCLVGLSCLKDGLSAEEKNEVRDINSRKMMEKKKLHLVINIDNDTLFRWTDSNHIELRPYAPIFFKEISVMYDITFYTKTDSIAHLERIYSALDFLNDSNTTTTSFMIDHTIDYVHHTIDYVLKSSEAYLRRPRLDSLLAHDRNIVVVDEKGNDWEGYGANLVLLAPYRVVDKEKRDLPLYDFQGLIELKVFLKYIHETFFNEDDDNRYDDVGKIIWLSLRCGAVAQAEFDRNLEKWHSRRQDLLPGT